MAKVQPAFNVRFRVVDNNSANPNAPERNMIMDFTCESAMKMADFLMKKIDEAHVNDTTIRIYTDKKEFTEESGFSLWGGMWGNSGRLQPLPPKDGSQGNVGSRGQTVDVNDLPF